MLVLFQYCVPPGRVGGENSTGPEPRQKRAGPVSPGFQVAGRTPSRARRRRSAGLDGVFRTPFQDLVHQAVGLGLGRALEVVALGVPGDRLDRKSTRLNSSHVKSSYAVFCLKKKT